MSCREIAKQFKIGKTQAANAVKNEASLKAEYENFQWKGFKHLKRENHQKFKTINTVLYKWFKKCEAYGIYVSDSCLKKKWWISKVFWIILIWMTLKTVKAGLINGSLVIAYVKCKYLASLSMYEK